MIIKIRAEYTEAGNPQAVTFRSEDYATREEAEAIAEQFPKSARIRVYEISTFDRETYRGYIVYAYGVRIKLVPDGVNKGVNETGMRRYRSTLRHAVRLGHEIEWTAPFANSYPTVEAFVEAIAQYER